MTTDPSSSEPDPTFRNHLLPRTVRGTILTLLFLAVFAFTQPPLVFRLANKVEPWVAGWPFLYAYLFIAYVVLIVILIIAARSRDRTTS